MNERSPGKPGSPKSLQVKAVSTAADVPWSMMVRVTDVPESGRRFDLVADDDARRAIAKLADVVSIPSLAAAFELTPLGRDGVRVVGKVSGNVVQNCVVTLEAMDTRIEELVDLAFMPHGPGIARVDTGVAGVIGVDDADPPQVLEDGGIDLGAIATEFLILGIDPYPRKPDAAFEAPIATEDPSLHPFAALQALKKN